MSVKRKITSLTVGLMLTATILSGCGKSNGIEALDFSNTTLSGTVTAVEDNKVTISLAGGMGGGRMNDGRQRSNSNVEMPNENGDTSSTDASGDQPFSELPLDGDGMTPPEISDGEMPELPEGADMENLPEMPNDTGNGTGGRGGFFGGFASGGTTFTLTIADESLLSECTMSDIVEGAYITITFGDDNTISSISAMKLTNTNSGNEASDSNDEEDSL